MKNCGVRYWKTVVHAKFPAESCFRFPLSVLKYVFMHVFQLGKFLKESNIPLHMDGARVFNAAVCLGVPVSRVVKHCDSVTFCLSKGLGAPIGSVLAGSNSFIEK